MKRGSGRVDTCTRIVRQYPNFYRIYAGNLAVAWRHDLENGGYVLITKTQGPGLPDAQAERVLAGRYTANDRLTASRTMSLGKLEAWIDQQLGFK